MKRIFLVTFCLLLMVSRFPSTTDNPAQTERVILFSPIYSERENVNSVISGWAPMRKGRVPPRPMLT